MADSIKINVAERLLPVTHESLMQETFLSDLPDVYKIDAIQHQEIGVMDEAATVAEMHSRTGGEGAKVKTIVKTEQEPGPNDPCPCGSGRKYKKCCRNS